MATTSSMEAVTTSSATKVGNPHSDETSNNNGGTGGASSATAIGGIAAPAVEDTGDADRPFGVNGDSFTSQETAAQRACDAQRNSCFDAVNFGQADGFDTSDCDAQVGACVAELTG